MVKGGTMQGLRELRVWQAAMELVTCCYQFARAFPGDERFGLTSQLQRAAVSVPANIAEGHGRGTTGAFINYLWIANGPQTELETNLLISVRLGYVTDSDISATLERIDSVGRMLTALRRSLESRDQ